MRLSQLFEPEETVGKLWHDMASRLGEETSHSDTAVSLSDIRTSLALQFRALGGAHNVDIDEAPPVRTTHRRSLRRRLAKGADSLPRPSFDGERLRLPPLIGCFESAALNRAAYFWLTASAALAPLQATALPVPEASPEQLDEAYIRLNAAASKAVYTACPGLRAAHSALCAAVLNARDRDEPTLWCPSMERALRDHLRGQANGMPTASPRAGARRIAPVPFWIEFRHPPGAGPGAEAVDETKDAPTPLAAYSRRKIGERRNLDQADRKDSFIVHRFESILSWVESMNINRSVDDDDEENAQKAADDQDLITLSRHHKKTASRLRLHLDLSPSEAEHERLAGKFTYPEWNYRGQRYMTDHCRVLEADADPSEETGFVPDARSAERVRRQFEVLRPRRILQSRQTEGAELDLDALIAARTDLAASGRGSDRIYLASRQIERDLSVALLLDTSRSTESDMGGTCVIDVARHALSALAHGLDACGDRFGIWGFSSLKRNRVFLTRCKSFDAPMSARIDRSIAALRPGHYTRLGAAIRHVSEQLAQETSAQRLLLVLTDGKPNDLDHYEGKHGIEDSRMAVREARRQHLVLHGVVIDEDGQDWFARIFGRGGFTLLPRPERLISALPDIYRTLTQET